MCKIPDSSPGLGLPKEVSTQTQPGHDTSPSQPGSSHPTAPVTVSANFHSLSMVERFSIIRNSGCGLLTGFLLLLGIEKNVSLKAFFHFCGKSEKFLSSQTPEGIQAYVDAHKTVVDFDLDKMQRTDLQESERFNIAFGEKIPDDFFGETSGSTNFCKKLTDILSMDLANSITVLMDLNRDFQPDIVLPNGDLISIPAKGTPGGSFEKKFNTLAGAFLRAFPGDPNKAIKAFKIFLSGRHLQGPGIGPIIHAYELGHDEGCKNLTLLMKYCENKVTVRINQDCTITVHGTQIVTNELMRTIEKTEYGRSVLQLLNIRKFDTHAFTHSEETFTYLDDKGGFRQDAASCSYFFTTEPIGMQKPPKQRRIKAVQSDGAKVSPKPAAARTPISVTSSLASQASADGFLLPSSFSEQQKPQDAANGETWMKGPMANVKAPQGFHWAPSLNFDGEADVPILVRDTANSGKDFPNVALPSGWQLEEIQSGNSKEYKLIGPKPGES
jgi:hypothetical protein